MNPSSQAWVHPTALVEQDVQIGDRTQSRSLDHYANTRQEFTRLLIGDRTGNCPGLAEHHRSKTDKQ